MELFVRVSLVLLWTAVSSLGIDKHWLPDLEWRTGSNWVDNLLPDADSSVIFPEQTWHTVGLPNSGNIEVAKIYLPKEGSLAFGSNAVLTFSESKKPEKFAKWTKKGLYLWIDPENWDGYTDATPHADRIPCRKDIVVLPSKDRALSIALPNVEVQVAGVRIADDELPLRLWQWQELANQPREFTSSRLTVTYSNKYQMALCNDCTCHVDESVAKEVCSFMWQADKCAPPTCEYPLKVEGHCCDFCGGRLALSDKASAHEVEPRVNEALKNLRDVITWHVRSKWNGGVEVLIAERGEYSGIHSEEAVDVLSKALIAEGYEILENQATGAALESSPLEYILGPLLGIPVILILLMLVLFPYYGYSYSQVFSASREAFASCRASSPSQRKAKPGGMFSFARFKNVAEGDVDLAESIVTEDTEPLEVDSDVDRPSSSSKRFENPLYRSSRDIEKNKPVEDEKMIDIDAPMSLAVLESRVKEEGIEEISLE